MPDDIYLADVVYKSGIESRYLRIQDLRRLQYVEFTTRRPIDGLYSGRHASPQRGQSVEFRDYRDARVEADRYASRILPNAQTTIDLVTRGFEAGELRRVARAWLFRQMSRT